MKSSWGRHYCEAFSGSQIDLITIGDMVREANHPGE